MSRWPVKPKRSYQSAVRDRQAAETRQRIAAAGRRLLAAKGYAAMTIDAVAREAEVAAQTVYAVFGSKIGILNEILDETRFDESYQELVRQARTAPDPHARLRLPHVSHGRFSIPSGRSSISSEGPGCWRRSFHAWSRNGNRCATSGRGR